MQSEKLVEEIRKFPVLYDQRDVKYRNVEYKETVWKVISETLKAPGGPNECKKKWASIRDQFRRTLQKRKTKSGQANKYKYEKILEFLLPHLVEKETLLNVSSTELHWDDSPFDQSVEEPEKESEKDPKTERQSITEVWSQPGKNKETQSASSPQQHPVDIFLAGLAPTLKSLDPLLLNQAKTAIFTIVQDFELKQLMKYESDQQLTRSLSLATNHTTFSRMSRSNESSHSSFTN